MAIERIGLPADLVRRIGQTFRRRGRRDAFGDGVIALHGAEFGFEIGLAVDAFARNPGIKEIRPPIHVDRDVGRARNRAFEPVLADIAPGTNDVGNDIDMHARGIIR